MSAPNLAREERARLKLRRDILLAREDPKAFVRLVGRKEGNRPVRQGRVHDEWQDTFSANDRVVLFAPIGHGKSSQIRWRVLWEIGRNPNIRVGMVSVSKSGMPTKALSAIRGDVERNRALRVVFPRLRPQRSGQRMWSDRGIIVERDDNVPDPTVQLFGLYGKILGSRLDLIILDDVCNLENTLTERSREKMWEWVSGEVFGRLPPGGGGRVWSIGHVWHKEDVNHRMGRIRGYHARRDSAFLPGDVPGAEVPLIPELWSLSELQRREEELGRLAPHMLRNIIPIFDDARIKQAWVERCLERGAGTLRKQDISSDEEAARGFGGGRWGVGRWNPSDSPTFTGVDLSVTGEGDLAALVTITILPDGSRRLLDVRSGRWTGPRILKECVDVHGRYGSIVMVETNAAQRYLNQFASELVTMPLREHNTGMNKHDFRFGIESLGTEMSMGKWMFPCSHDMVPPREVAAMLREATTYTPTEHSGDRLMAMWIARECARQCGYGTGGWSPQDEDDFFDVDTLSR